MESLNSDLFLYEATAFRFYRNAAFNLSYYPVYKPIIAYFLSLLTCLICGNSLVFAIGIPFVITNYFCGDKPIYAALNAARSTASTTSGVCLA